MSGLVTVLEEINDRGEGGRRGGGRCSEAVLSVLIIEATHYLIHV